MCSVNQTADFFYHAFFESCVETAVYANVALIPIYECTYIIGVLWQEGCALNRVLGFVYGYLKGSDQTFARVVVCCVVEWLERCEPGYELLI